MTFVSFYIFPGGFMANDNLLEFCELITSIFEHRFEAENFKISDALRTLSIAFRIYPSGSALINDSDPADRIFLIVQGSVQIQCYNIYGEKSIQGIMYAPEFFGLVEVLTKIPSYTSSVIANEPLGAFSIPASLFKQALSQDIKLANIVIQRIADFSSLKMRETVEENLYKPIDLLILYLYKQSGLFKLPYIIKMKRADLADLLHIELRTLYRYIKILQESNMCTLRNGKMIISKNNFINLEKHALELKCI